MSPHEPRSLIVMRHATAEPYAAEDELRQLTTGGTSAARAAGRWLATAGLAPDHAWVSAASRTRETWEAAKSAAEFEVEAQVEASIYTAGPETLIDLIQQTPAEARTVLLIGHNPTVAYLSHLLDDGQPDPDAWQQIIAGFPPAAMAVFDVSVPWADIALASAHLRDFHVGGHHD